MESLKPCACGKTPENLCIMDGSTYRWRYVSGICCGEWQIEARVDRADRTDTEAIEAECVRAWNDAPRASTMPGELVEEAKNAIFRTNRGVRTHRCVKFVESFLACHEGKG